MGTFEINNKSFSCPVELTLNTIMGKWKVLVLWNLRNGTFRYNELHKAINGVSHKMLIQALRELESDGVVERTVYPVVPPKVEYSLTKEGKNIVPILEKMQQWGMRYLIVEEDD
jgi:DNA-binding HxlR family transcriptional regulator